MPAVPPPRRSRIAVLGDDVRRDLRHALRIFRKAPGFVVSAVLPLSLCIAATTTVYGVVNALLLRPIPAAQPDRLFAVNEARRGPNIGNSMGYSTLQFWRYLEWRDAATADIFDGLAAMSFDQYSMRRDGGAETVTGYLVSGNFFDVLGLRPARGRFFTGEQDGHGAGDPVVVLSHSFWQRRFNGDPSITDSTLYFNGRALQVSAVGPPRFTGIYAGIEADVFIPAQTYLPPRNGPAPERLAGSFTLFGRLQSGMAVEQAETRLVALSTRVPPDNANVEIVDVELIPLRTIPPVVRNGAIGFAGALFLTAAAVMLVAIFNVASMLLARAALRRHEIAVRLAIGAGRSRLVRQMLTEGVLLFGVAAGGGLLLASWLTALLSAWEPWLPVRIVFDVRLDGGALAVALVLSLGIGLLFSLLPAFQETRWHPATALRQGAGLAVRRTRTRSVFVVAQLAVSLVLLVAAGLFARALQHALASDPGFDPDRVAIAGVSPGSHGYERERALALFDALEARLLATPGIEAAGFGQFLPLTGSTNNSRARRAGAADDDVGVRVQYGFADGGYFDAVPTPLVAGRHFEAADRTGPPVTVINETLADRLWPGESAVGQGLFLNGQTLEVVGVTSNGRYNEIGPRSDTFVFLPLREGIASTRMVYVKSRTSAPDAVAKLRDAVAALDPDIALERAGPLEALVEASTIAQRIAAIMIGGFGSLGLLLAAIGVYGIVAYQVAQRTREFGVRRAIGATSADVRRLVLGDGIRLALVGGAAGLLAAGALLRLAAGVLGNLAPPDPVPFVVFPLVLGIVGVLASWIPARRASKSDPMTALRSD